LVDYEGAVIYDAFVKVDERVTDFRTQYSGVRPKNLKSKEAVTFAECCAEVAKLLKGKVLVGHALKNDLAVLLLSHPRNMIRDTATYRPLMRFSNGKFKPRKLRDLSKQHLGMVIQGGEHTPDEDARAAMLLYRQKRKEWEDNLRVFKGNVPKAPRPVRQPKETNSSNKAPKPSATSGGSGGGGSEANSDGG
jgi:RNA exonuclease 4